MAPYRDQAEVARFLATLETGGQASSLDYHYLYRRYVDREPFQSQADYQSFCAAILKTGDGLIYKQVSKHHARYIVYRPSDRWLAIVDGQSHHTISAFRLSAAANPYELGEFLCRQYQLLQ